MSKFSKDISATPQTLSNIEALRTIMITLHGINQRLEGVIHPDIYENLEKLYDLAHTQLQPVLEQEQRDWQTNFDALSKLQKEHNLRTVWSITEVNAWEMDKKTPPISKLTYQSWGPTQVHTFEQPTELTWLEFWKLADKLIKDSGDDHHIFVEGLYQEEKDKGTNNYNICTGS